jgi:23S rRNA (cytidine1920-2'-O)/16S rRNA (cytidine1409-2'-O)-methyltransferase
MSEKQRLDLLLVERGVAPSREKAQAMIMAGEVLVDGQRIDKAGTQVSPSVEISTTAKPRFVSRGGEKLEAALQAFPVTTDGRVCADIGASTGGFTDCLLQHGASRVYAIDVGYGQMALNLREDRRVVLMERTNARHLDSLPDPIDLLVVDASFISLRLLLPAAQRWLTPDADAIALVKPQFEAGPRDVGKGGVVRDRAVHRRVLHEILQFARGIGLQPCGLIQSPLKGPAGNIEFLAWLNHGSADLAHDIDAMIGAVMGG